MRINTILYSAKQGVLNIFRNKMFSLASIATMAACIFMFGIFYILISNFTATLKTAEEGVAITVFFDEGVSAERIKGIRDDISKRLFYLFPESFRLSPNRSLPQSQQHNG